MLIASHLAAPLQAGSGNLSGTATGYPGQARQAAEGLKGAAALLEEIAARASQARRQPDLPVMAGCFIGEGL
jgi:hypothetical protein